VVLGPSGVGKSISVATEAQRLMDDGVPVLLFEVSSSHWNKQLNRFLRKIWPAITDLSWQKVIEVLTKMNRPRALSLSCALMQ